MGTEKDLVSPVAEYNSFSEVIQETKATLVLDLRRMVKDIPDEVITAIKPHPAGVYVSGLLEPVFSFHRDQALLVSKSEAGATEFTAAENFDQFIEHKGLVVSKNKKILCSNPSKTKHLYKQEPDINYGLCYLIAGVLMNQLDGLPCQHPHRSRIKDFLLKDHVWLGEAFKDIDITRYKSVLDGITALNTFIGSDYYNVYSLDIRAFTVVIEKGNDFRVIEYYKSLFDKFSEERFEKHGF